MNPKVRKAWERVKGLRWGAQPIPDYGDLMTLKDFVECVESGGFINYDGHGYYSDGQWMFEKVIPSDIKGKKPKNYSHVVWFNK